MRDAALEVIASTKIGTLATLCEDGAPYSTPVTYSFDGKRFTWKSSPDAVHSINLERDKRASFTIVEKSDGKARAVYVNGSAVATGEVTFEEKWQTTLAEYEVVLGELDTQKTTPGRFYFQGDAA